MKIKIEIECDTVREILAHLFVIRRDIRKESKKLKLNLNEDEFPKNVKLQDNNCYGTHDVKIIVKK